ncbi:cell wall metabolism sensor histidine kinase WalK [Bacillus sp. HMF5848]|uniref:cell wall metabolism sensor histidine kinase WalK n=1 Tax=Bacillus sp. HMF5848 TaxID=2495421 RepID=UPI000F7796A8|nr:cell wall metabolism sensor histidine kinase WalK [Bacillus sp. HMF5848]RSK29170.1 cell wall metabolism sensor histidine kinase WalK [Bacillus sp. HMF5848]
MKKVGFFRSIHLKFVLIYVLLILLAMQIIGAYFVRQLEAQLVSNFSTSLEEHASLLSYNLERELSKERNEESATLEEDIGRILHNYVTDLYQVHVIDSKSKVLGVSNPYSDIVGKRTTNVLVKRALVVGASEKMFVDPTTGHRMRALATPIRSQATNEVLGVVYILASMEDVYAQMRQINNIFASGTVIAMGITALLGIFLAQTITRPISDMRKQALAMARGDFSRKVHIYGFDEIGQLAMTFNNLTKKLKEAQATTEGERRKLMSVLTHMTDGVLATDRKGRVMLINEPALKMLGVSRETVMGEPLIDVLKLANQYSFESLADEHESLILDFSKKNFPLILRANFSIIQKESGLVNGIITVLHDITEQEKIDAERREFVQNVSHELRTPLTTMRSYLDALVDGAWQDESIAPNFLSVTQNETERMIRLVNDLLQLSKMDSKDYRLTKDWIDFTNFYNHIIDRFEMTKASNVEIIRQIPDQTVFVEMDEDKIIQVLDNIISNAIKYSPEGGDITCRLQIFEYDVQVSVFDQGVGIPEENLPHIFDRFYRVDKARSRKLGGTGLGLAIAREMVLAHNGAIWAESEEGQGTAIHFTLPLTPVEEGEWSDV